MAAQDTRVGERQLTSMRIKLKYPDVETFIQKYAVNISRGGIFISTKQPKPVGTFLRFEFLLSNAESSSIIRGEGQVQWTKEFDAAAPNKAHGMGVKFTRLDAESQAVIDRALRWRAEQQAGAGAAAAPAASPAPAAPVTTTASAAPSASVPLQTHVAASSGSVELGAEPAARVATPPMVLPEAPAEASAPVVAAVAAAVAETRAEHGRPSTTRPITLARAAAATGADRGDLDALASEWGVSPERLARVLERRRPRVAEVTAELERLLLKPQLAPPSKAEALAGLSALLDRRGEAAIAPLPARDPHEPPDDESADAPARRTRAR